MHTVIIQFMNGWIDYWELKGVAMLSPFVEIHQAGRDTFVNKRNPDPEDVRLAREGWDLATAVILGKKADLVVLDEINCAADYGLIPAGDVIEVLRRKPDGIEIVMTGRGAPGEFLEIADLVTEMREIKHYYAKGVDARIGVER